MNDQHDPFDPRRLQQRARGVFARAARMQDLHGQALAQEYATRPSTPVQDSAQVGNPAELLTQHACGAIASALGRLNAAAATAAQIAASDAVISRLNATINGIDVIENRQRDVVDVDAVEVTGDPNQSATGGRIA